MDMILLIILLLVHITDQKTLISTDANHGGIVTPIRVVSISVGDDYISGYSVSSAAYDLAFQEAKQLHPRVFRDFAWRTYTTPGNYYTCQEGSFEMMILMSKVYNITLHDPFFLTPGAVTIFLTPGCSEEAAVLGDATREYDVPLIASTASDRSLSNRRRYPTTVLFGIGGYSTIAQSLHALFHQNKWNRMSVIVDKGAPPGSPTTALYIFFTSFNAYFATYNMEINIVTITANSSNDTYASRWQYMNMAKGHSSVIVVVSLLDYWHDLMNVAVDLGLNDGNYVFFWPHVGAGYFNGSTKLPIKSHKTASILPYTFEFGLRYPDLQPIQPTLDAIRSLAKTRYGYHAPNKYPLTYYQIAPYEAALSLIQILDEVYEHLTNISTKNIVQLFYNRTFDILDESIAMSANGSRLVDATIGHFNSLTASYKEIWYFKGGTGLLFNVSGGVIHWNGTKFPPNSYYDPSLRLRNYSQDNILYILLVIGVIVIGALIGVRQTQRQRNNAEDVWLIPLREILQREAVTDIHLASYRIKLFTDDGTAWLSKTGLYKDKPVRLLVMATNYKAEDVKKNDVARKALTLVYSLDHPNIARFYGIAFSDQDQNGGFYLVSEEARKGILRKYIDQDELTFSWDLRYSLIWDLLNGIQYIHKSIMRSHGALNFLSLLLDEHFTLKIAHAGRLYICKKLRIPPKDVGNTLPLVSSLWLAPEVLQGHCYAATAASDSYSIGVILYEVITRNMPFNVDVSNTAAVSTLLSDVQNGLLNPHNYPLPDTDPSVIKIIKQCWSFDPLQRPTLEEITQTLKKVYPSAMRSFTDKLIRRLEKFNADLEGVVGARTRALKEEKDNVDRLLSCVLPPSVVRQLREKHQIEPEFFESVSILFSAIPAFKDIAAVCSPWQITEVLHELYGILDEIIDPFDAYKVESISDSYMVVSGLPIRNGSLHASQIAQLALVMMEAMEQYTSPIVPADLRIQLRIGMNSGPCVGMVIGQKLPHYCVVGDAVNTASRMEVSGEVTKIQTTEATKHLLNLTNKFDTASRGLIDIKGKGQLTTYWLIRMRE